MEIKKYFDLLGLKENATIIEVKKAYREMVKLYHPDRFDIQDVIKKKSEEKLKEINDAYKRLSSYFTLKQNEEINNSNSIISVLSNFIKGLWADITNNKEISNKTPEKILKTEPEQRIKKPIKNTSKNKIKNNISPPFKKTSNKSETGPVSPIKKVSKIKPI